MLFIVFFVAIKSLSGYEYLSNIVLSPLVAIVYYKIKWQTPLKNILLKSLLVFMAGCLGFVTAFLIHFGQLFLYTKNVEEALKVIWFRANSRTLHGFFEAGSDTFLTLEKLHPEFKTIENPIAMWASVLKVSHKIQLVQRHWLWGIKNLYFILFSTIVGLLYCQSCSSKIRAVSISLLLAVIVSLSWGILAVSHHIVHGHMNSITYHIPLYLWAFVTIPFLFWRGSIKNVV